MKSKVKLFFIVTVLTIIYSYLGRDYVFTEIDIKAGYWSYLSYSIFTFIIAFILLIKIQTKLFKRIPFVCQLYFENNPYTRYFGSIFGYTLLLNLLLSAQFVFTNYGKWKLNVSTAEENLFFQKTNKKQIQAFSPEEIAYIDKAVVISKTIIKDPAVEKYTLELRDNYLKSKSRLPASK